MDIRNIPMLFGLPEASELNELNKGHINRTYLAVCGGKEYVLQSLNRSVFRSPEAVMDNISRIEAAFAEIDCADIAVPHFLLCGDRNFTDIDDEIWRIYGFIPSSADTSANIMAVGRAFGTFIRTMDGRKLNKTPAIEGFHDFDRYFTTLASKNGIDKSVMNTLDRLRGTLAQIFGNSLKKRVIHGDAKNDNIIVSEKMTIIDLDTVMNGYAAIDYGDLVRSVCRNGVMDFPAVHQMTEGFAQGLCGILSNDEVHSLYFGVLWLTGELAVRYLIDSKSENKYFRGKTSAECLSRAEELLYQLSQFTTHGGELTEMIYSSFDR